MQELLREMVFESKVRPGSIFNNDDTSDDEEEIDEEEEESEKNENKTWEVCSEK